MELEQIKQSLKQILVERLSIDMKEVKVDDDAGLFDEDGWGMDSVDALDLVLGIEKTFGVRINRDEGVKRHFRSINTLAAFIREHVVQEAA
jgi:acyl carrier protein